MTGKLLKELEAGSKSALAKKKIISYFIYNGSATITDIAKEMDLSVPTITKLINEMCDDGFINDYGKLETSAGRHPNLYGLRPESGYFVGVDINKFTINIGLINFKGDTVHTKTNIPFKNENTPEALKNLCEVITEFIDNCSVSREKIMNICVTISGRVNPETGYSFSMFNFSENPLAEILSDNLGFPVCIDNDTRVMAYGEYLKGAANGEKNMIFVNLSWGLGIGIIIDGKIYKGKSGYAGELGHIKAFDNEILCHCGKKGCLETEVSGVALHRILVERIKDGGASILTKKLETDKEIGLDVIVDAINKEDPLCIEVMEDVGSKLGKHIAGLINIFNPELIILGGKLSLTGDYILQPVKTAIKKYSLNLVNRDSTFALSKLGDKAGVIGACLYARSRMFDI